MSYVVGLTGGIGSGKSTIAHLFAEHNVPIIDADVVARQVVEKGSPLLAEIIAHFGAEILLENGELNRAHLRQLVFQSPAEKTWLNNLLHPAIRAEMLKQLTQIQSPYVIWVVPLLIENQLTAFCDRVLVVDVSPEIQLQRVALRDKSHLDTLKNIIAAQVDRSTRLAVADDIVENSLPLAENFDKIRQQIDRLHHFYLAQGIQKMAQSPSVTTVNCPTCDKAVVWSSESKFRPFCSERCQLIDLGEWADEKRVIAGSEQDMMSQERENSF